MDNNKNLFRILLAVAIIVGFFMPWFMHSGSGWDIAMAKSANDAENTTTVTIIRYSFFLIPLFALLVLIRSASRQSSHFLLRAGSFLVTAILSALFAIGVSAQFGNESMNSFMSILGAGYYITVVASFLLIFVGG